MEDRACIAFAGDRRIAKGPLAEVALELKKILAVQEDLNFLVFDEQTSQPVELDLRGTVSDVTQRYQMHADPESEKKAGPGRPKLGVVSREITLLPRHWDWLALQSGSASTTIRRLIDEARKASFDKDRTRQARDATYKFMAAMAGNLPLYEEALRALYANRLEIFQELISAWPGDIRDHTLDLASQAKES